MNAYRMFLRVWIAITSVIGFVAGWVFIARAAEMDTVTYIGSTSISMPELPPVPTVEGLTGETLAIGNVQSFTVNIQPSQQTFTQPMRTGGS